MEKLLTAVFGGNNRNTTVAGIGALLVVVGSILFTGTIPDEALAAALGLLGLGATAARDGGTGSDA